MKKFLNEIYFLERSNFVMATVYDDLFLDKTLVLLFSSEGIRETEINFVLFIFQHSEVSLIFFL